MAMRRIGVLVESSYEDLELWYPLLRLREAGFEAITIGPEEGKIYNSKHGYPCKADKSIADVKAEDLDGLIVPGGWCPDYLRRDRRFVHLVAEVAKSGRLVGSICHGPWLLCSARCIAGRRATCFVAIRDDVENAGAKYEDLPVVVDGNLVTSRTPSDLNHFMKAVLEVLSKQS